MTVFSWPVMLTPDGAAPEVEEALVEFVPGRAGNLREAVVLSWASRAALLKARA
jgi:hypothetical protein